MQNNPILKIKLPIRLANTLEFFQAHCVPDCCGLGAFAFAPVYACHAIKALGRSTVSESLQDLENVARQIAEADIGEVDVEELCERFDKEEAIHFFELLKQDILNGLAIGPIDREEPHELNDKLMEHRVFRTKRQQEWDEQARLRSPFWLAGGTS